MACLILLALPLLLLLSHSPSASGTAYQVGQGYVSSWTTPSSTLDYYLWTLGITFRSGDVLSFTYDYSQHNVWQFPDYLSYSTCDFSGGNQLDSDHYELVVLPDIPSGSSEYLYFGSSRGTDCADGMQFYFVLYPADGNSPPSPTGTFPSTPRAAQPKKKTSVPVAAIVVPLLLVLAIAVGVTIFCFFRAKAKARMAAAAQAGGGGAGFPPPSPLPTLHPIKVPEGAPPQAPWKANAAPPPPPPPPQGGYVPQYQQQQPAAWNVEAPPPRNQNGPAAYGYGYGGG